MNIRIRIPNRARIRNWSELRSTLSHGPSQIGDRSSDANRSTHKVTLKQAANSEYSMHSLSGHAELYFPPSGYLSPYQPTADNSLPHTNARATLPRSQLRFQRHQARPPNARFDVLAVACPPFANAATSPTATAHPRRSARSFQCSHPPSRSPPPSNRHSILRA